MSMKLSFLFSFLISSSFLVMSSYGQQSVPNGGLEKLLVPQGVPSSQTPSVVPPQGGSPIQSQGVPVPQSQVSRPVIQPVPGTSMPASSRQVRRDEDFQRALEAAVPLGPDQIKTFREKTDEAKKATLYPLNHANPISRSVRVTLKPGESPPVMHVQPGVASTLTLSDVTGQPWPVLSVVNGNPSAYSITSAGEEGKTNILVVSALQEYTPSNMVVTLVGYPVPVTLVLDSARANVDYRLDVRIESRGPNAVQDIVGVSNLAPTNDGVMINFLDGVPPSNSRSMKTSSRDVEAWKLGDVMYLRTRGDVLSPAYTARSSNVSGVNVFQMVDSPIVLLSIDGRLSQVSVHR